MKVIVADKISERGVELLKKSGLNTVLTTKETIAAELAEADALIVRSATRRDVSPPGSPSTGGFDPW